MKIANVECIPVQAPGRTLVPILVTTDTGLVGVASYSARGKQYIVSLRPFNEGLIMHQLRYADEVKPWSEVPPELEAMLRAQVATKPTEPTEVPASAVIEDAPAAPKRRTTRKSTTATPDDAGDAPVETATADGVLQLLQPLQLDLGMIRELHRLRDRMMPGDLAD